MDSGATITINCKALQQSVQRAQDRDSEESLSLSESGSSEDSAVNDTQQTITFKAEHVERARKKHKEGGRQGAKRTTTQYLEADPIPEPSGTVTHRRSDNGRHSLRPKVQTVDTDNFSSDEFGDEGSDDDFRSTRRPQKKRPKKKPKPAAEPKKPAAPVVPRAPVAMSAGAVIMQKARQFLRPQASKPSSKKGKSSVRSRLSSKFGRR